ncbi:MAG: ASPIC/UnbV domain-containing protein [Acidobacteria bacterium]|nr:ASPIC/UnbV domain-containing protein [Acidobacteriota bacterium]
MTQDNSDGGKRDKGVLRQDQNELLGKGFSFSGYERDTLFLNLGKSESGQVKYTEISGVSGIDHVSDGRASVFADFDNDGDLDVFMSTIQGQAHLLFRNNVGQTNHWLRVALAGQQGGRDAFGAVVRVKTSAGILTKIKAGGAGFQSQHDPRLLFGLGRDAQAEWVEVTWPNGRQQRIANVAAGSSLLVTEGVDKFEAVRETKACLPDPLTREDLLLQTLKLKKGQPFPALTVNRLTGARAPLSASFKRGRRTLINLWATWCGPCAKEMPELEHLAPGLRAQGIDLIGVSIDTEGVGVVKEFLRRRPVSYPIFNIGEQGIAQIFAGDEAAVPLSALLDERGHVQQVIGGWSRQTKREFEALTKKRKRDNSRAR